jgi:hypothetical protein
LLRGRRKPPLRVLLKNLFFLLRAKRVAAERAEALLRHALADPWFSDHGVARARIEFDLGELYAATGRADLALGHFERARSIAVAQEVPRMLARIDAAIGSNQIASTGSGTAGGRRSIAAVEPP